MKNPILPLFPLALVVFPGQVVPLHIFEERYKAMIAACRAGAGGPDNGAFGISFQEATLHRVGCSLRIEKILHEYEDGRLDLLAVGKQRYRMLKLYDDQPYFTAAVEFFEDRQERKDRGLSERVAERYRLLRLMAVELWRRNSQMVASSHPSFRIAQGVDLDLDQRQHLLETTSENRRLRVLEEYLERRLAAAYEYLEERRRTQANGLSRSAKRPGDPR